MARLEERVKAKTMQERIADLRARRAEIELGGGRERIEKQHASGKLTARERIAALVDKSSFEEVGCVCPSSRFLIRNGRQRMCPRMAWSPGQRSVEGRLIHLASQDFTVLGGAAGEVHCSKIVEMMIMSLKTGTPVRLHQRLRRCARAGGHRQPRRICARVLQKRAALGNRSANRCHLRPVRRRSSLQPRAD